MGLIVLANEDTGTRNDDDDDDTDDDDDNDDDDDDDDDDDHEIIMFQTPILPDPLWKPDYYFSNEKRTYGMKAQAADR